MVGHAQAPTKCALSALGVLGVSWNLMLRAPRFQRRQNPDPHQPRAICLLHAAFNTRC